MPDPVRPCVTADVYERGSGIPRALAQLGCAVRIEPLPAGDYSIGADVLVERKSTLDLHAAIMQGRFWTQIGKLRRASRFPFLLVEGADIDCGPLSQRAVRGACIAVIHQGIRLLRTTSRDDSAQWLERLAVRSAKYAPVDRPRYAQQPRLGTALAAEAMLAAVPGISTTGARSLLRQFGSVANVLAAGEEAWREVPGIGLIRAKALADAFGASGS
jgi:DNA excision repair protein ERCC-4